MRVEDGRDWRRYLMIITIYFFRPPLVCVWAVRITSKALEDSPLKRPSPLHVEVH